MKDAKFKKKLRNTLRENLPISIFELENLDHNKEFELYKMKIYNREAKELIKEEIFKKDNNYYYLKINNNYFFIPSNNLLYLYHHDFNNQTAKKILGLEENLNLSNEESNFFFEKNEVNENIKTNEADFFSYIKFNLISKKTYTYIGENNNIPEDILDNYYLNNKLISKEKNLNFICLEKNEGCMRNSGRIHYPMKKFYIKLISQKGKFDAIFITEKEFYLSSFQCNLIYSNFQKLGEKSKIIFEFINEDSNYDKVISQATNYQINAKAIFKNEPF